MDILKETPIFDLRGVNIQCEVNIPSDLWPVEFYAGQINQVINNLIINARQAMPAGDNLKIHAENIFIKGDKHPLINSGKYIKISIKDNGIGISKENQDKIFDPFFTTKEDSSALSRRGNQMQLALRPVKKYGVTLKVEGTTVTFSGCIDTTRPGEFMQPFIKELNREIISNKIQSITLDITQLAYLNSSGIREIVDWILYIDALPSHQKYRIHIIYNSRYIWQESSTSTFVFLNTDFISKEVI